MTLEEIIKEFEFVIASALHNSEKVKKKFYKQLLTLDLYRCQQLIDELKKLNRK